MTAKIVQFPLSLPVAPLLPMSGAEEFFWRQMVPHCPADEALERAYALAAAEQLALRAGVIFEWDITYDDWFDPSETLTMIMNGTTLSVSFHPVDIGGDAMRVAEADMAQRLAGVVLHYLDMDPDPDDQPMAEWERELLWAAA